MKIGNLDVKTGEKRQGLFLAGGYELPMTIICGSDATDGCAGKTLLITAGIHSAEYVGIQAAIELSKELKPTDIDGTVIIMPLINVSGFTHRTVSMVYEDAKNLNREFPGSPNGTIAEQICHSLSTEIFPKIDYYIDLHSGDDYEELAAYAYYVGPVEAHVREKAFQMAQRVDTEWIVESQSATGGGYNYASSIGIPSILLERGGMGKWTRHEVEQYKEDVRRVLSYLQILKTDAGDGAPIGTHTIFTEVIYEDAPVGGRWYSLCMPGDAIKAGQIIGEIRDCFANTLYVCRAKGDGVILYQTGSLNVIKDGPMVAYGLLHNK